MPVTFHIPGIYEIATSSWINGPVLVEGDVKISIDGGDKVNLTNLPTARASHLYIIDVVLTDAENVPSAVVTFKDQEGLWSELFCTGPFEEPTAANQDTIKGLIIGKKKASQTWAESPYRKLNQGQFYDGKQVGKLVFPIESIAELGEETAGELLFYRRGSEIGSYPLTRIATVDGSLVAEFIVDGLLTGADVYNQTIEYDVRITTTGGSLVRQYPRYPVDIIPESYTR